MLLDRPLTSYYLIVGITMLLLGLGLVMVLSTASVTDLAYGESPYYDFERQLAGVVIGLPVMWLAARSSPRLFRAAAYPLVAIAAIGLGLTLIHGVGQVQNGAARWIQLGPLQFQPSELAKLALAVWGADLLARKEKLGLLADWRHILVPLMPARPAGHARDGRRRPRHHVHPAAYLSRPAVVRGYSGAGVHRAADPDGAGARAADGGRELPVERLTGFWNQSNTNPVGPNMQSIQGKYALGSGGFFGVGLGASREKWGWLPESTSDFIFAVIGEELGRGHALRDGPVRRPRVRRPARRPAQYRHIRGGGSRPRSRRGSCWRW